jgi:hypothetical protein
LEKLNFFWDLADAGVREKFLAAHGLIAKTGRAPAEVEHLNETIPQVGPPTSDPYVACKERDQDIPAFMDRRPEGTLQNILSDAIAQRAKTKCDAAEAPGV